MSIGWLAYVPIPGLALIPALVKPDDRLARFHAWQGGLLVVVVWLELVLLGFLLRLSDGEGFRLFIGALSLLAILGYFISALVGGIGAARDRFVRVWPLYDILSLLRRE